MLAESSLKKLNQKIKIKLTEIIYPKETRSVQGRKYLKNKEYSKYLLKEIKKLKKKKLTNVCIQRDPK